MNLISVPDTKTMKADSKASEFSAGEDFPIHHTNKIHFGMKKKNWLLLTIAAVFLGSCVNLDEYPYGFFSDKNFYNTPEEADNAMMYAYNAFNYNEYRRGYFDVSDLPTEMMDLKSGETQEGRREIKTWTVTPLTEGLNNFYKYSYVGINRSNAVIDNLAHIDFNEADKNQLLGEALFLRSYHLFTLTRLFGEVPIRTTMVSQVSDTRTNLGTLEEIYTRLITDLEKADELMVVNRRHGRGDKIAAQSLLSKVYLTLASSKSSGSPKFEWVTDADAMYSKAALWAGKVVNDQSEYGLDLSLNDIYNVDKWNGPEHIFFMSGDRTKTTGSAGMTDMFMPNNSYNAFYFKNEKNELYKSVWGWEVYRMNAGFYSTFEAGDKRATLLFTNKIYSANGTAIPRAPWIICTKYVDSSPTATWSINSTRPLFLRFSDVALVYAEASGATTEGYLWVNKIRNRAGLADLTSGLSNEDFRKAVLLERAHELAFEGHRLFELRRSHKIVEVLGDKEYAYFYPLPQEEIDMNPNITEDPDKKTLR
jgi:hypothetical protein